MHLFFSTVLPRAALNYARSNLFLKMIPAVLASAIPEDSTVTHRSCKSSSTSPKFCWVKPSKMFYCKICLSECHIKKGQTLEKCTCTFCKEVCKNTAQF